MIDGFQFQLCNVPIAKDESTVTLAGAHGPHSHLFSGVYAMDIQKDGSFINMDGMQTVALRDGVWEMIWRDESPAGLIICGFTLAEDARRNDSILEKGQIYITWPVWSKDGLEKQQARKADAEVRYKQFETESDDELEKMSNTPNILKKALNFCAAAAAVEKMDFAGLHNLVDVPFADDVFRIG